jgi:hypothetical protein
MNQSPSQSLSTYQSTTTGVLDYLKNQLSSITGWSNIPGSLVKVSSSPGGYTWGYNSTGDIYSCKNPCSPPNWKSMWAERRKGDEDSIIDIVTDSQFAYILTKWGIGRAILKVPIDAQDFRKLNMNDNVILLPSESDYDRRVYGNIKNLTVTDGYIQVSGETPDNLNVTATCPKPCNPSSWKINWLDNYDQLNGKYTDRFKLIGSGNKHTYFKSTMSSKILKNDETLQTGLKPINGLEGVNVTSLAADADNTALYASDNSKLYKCEGTCETKDQLKVVDTQGHLPIQGKGSLSIDPTSRTLWMLASDSVPGGNIFQRLDAPDVSAPVLDYANKTEDQRDRIVNSLGGTMAIQTAQISSGMAKQEAADAFKQLSDLSGDHKKIDNEIQLLERKIENTNNQLSGINDKKKPLLSLLIALAIVAIMYLTVGWFMPYGLSMGFAVIVLGTGLGFSIYFSTTK